MWASFTEWCDLHSQLLFHLLFHQEVHLQQLKGMMIWFGSEVNLINMSSFLGCSIKLYCCVFISQDHFCCLQLCNSLAIIFTELLLGMPLSIFPSHLQKCLLIIGMLAVGTLLTMQSYTFNRVFCCISFAIYFFWWCASHCMFFILLLVLALE